MWSQFSKDNENINQFSWCHSVHAHGAIPIASIGWHDIMIYLYSDDLIAWLIQTYLISEFFSSAHALICLLMIINSQMCVSSSIPRLTQVGCSVWAVAPMWRTLDRVKFLQGDPFDQHTPQTRRTTVADCIRVGHQVWIGTGGIENQSS